MRPRFMRTSRETYRLGPGHVFGLGVACADRQPAVLAVPPHLAGDLAAVTPVAHASGLIRHLLGRAVTDPPCHATRGRPGPAWYAGWVMTPLRMSRPVSAVSSTRSSMVSSRWSRTASLSGSPLARVPSCQPE